MERNHPTIGVCGIDCGLCPRFYTTGDSRCPGCGGTNFALKHPSCKIYNCALKKHDVTICSKCNEFPCSLISSWDKGDSFVSHFNCMNNLYFIKEDGYDSYLSSQQIRINLLEKLLASFDNGRSKSFYCLATNLLSIESIKAIDQFIDNTTSKPLIDELHEYILSFADKDSVVLKLRKS